MAQRWLAAKAGAAVSATRTSPLRRIARRAIIRRAVRRRVRVATGIETARRCWTGRFPNAGKSTLISTISAAKPKIADYPFTTLEPHLGVVDLGDFALSSSPISPDLIEGAHEGAGLGDRFLRHVERTRLLLHLVDVSSLSGRDAVSDYETINHELAAYDAHLARAPADRGRDQDRCARRAGAT